jgi:hypothetical protein
MRSGMGAIVGRRGAEAGPHSGYRRAVASFAFLSDEWIAAARALHAEYAGRLPAAPFAVAMNLVVTDIPFGSGRVLAHLDTSSGFPEVDLGHLDKPDLTVTTDYATVRMILVEGDAQGAMTAFLTGKIKVDGDIAKLLQLQSTGLTGADDPLREELGRRLQEITA